MYPIFALYTPKNYQCANDARYSLSEFNPNTTEYEYNGLSDICEDSCTEWEKLSSRSRRNAAAGGASARVLKMKIQVDRCYETTDFKLNLIIKFLN